ncbi:unnamed protein product, partial [Discosporangium mesarthrocarpum]
LSQIELWDRITQFQDGERSEALWDGDQAAALGHLSLIKDKADCPTNPLSYSHLSINRASGKGHALIVQWIHENTSVSASPGAMDAAAAGGHLQILKYLHEHRPEGGCTKYAMNQAAAGGHLDVVKWLHDNRSEGCTEKAMDGAAERGHLETLIWLHENI